MKSILLVGSLSNIHIYNYIVNVLSKANLQITIYHTSSIESIRDEYRSFYDSHNIKILGGYNINEIGKAKFMWHLYKTFRQIGSFDYLHLHYVSHYICPFIYLFRRKFKQIILSYWGSDLLRSSKIKRSLTKPIIDTCHQISFITSDMQSCFQDYYGSRHNNKCQILDFGNLFFKKIDDYQNLPLAQKHADLKEWGLDPEKKLLTIGYCGRAEMRQYETIQALTLLPQKYANNIQFIIPAWGISRDLKAKIIKLCDESHISHRIFDLFMGPEDIAKLRSLTDIFIHAQTSDALSSAMLEHLYGGSVVLNGAWLKYGCLNDNGVYYISFNDFNDLTSSVESILNNIDSYKEDSICNKVKISQLASWEVWANKWMKLYN